MQNDAVPAGANNDPRFVEYYAQASASDESKQRFRGIMGAILRSRRRVGLACEALTVADIGCSAGTQSGCWLEANHEVRGLDISSELVAIATHRNKQYRDQAQFVIGSATELPWNDATFDVCLLTELLEHVEDWRRCLTEAVRVLKPGGSLFVSTTNVLCPVQQEFSLPGYSWYPKFAKKHFVRLAKSTAPHLVSYASHPAYHWFSPYSLKSFLGVFGLRTHDRFDVMDLDGKGPLARGLVAAVRRIAPLRFVAHVMTPGTFVVGHKV